MEIDTLPDVVSVPSICHGTDLVERVRGEEFVEELLPELLIIIFEFYRNLVLYPCEYMNYILVCKWCYEHPPIGEIYGKVIDRNRQPRSTEQVRELIRIGLTYIHWFSRWNIKLLILEVSYRDDPGVKAIGVNENSSQVLIHDKDDVIKYENLILPSCCLGFSPTSVVPTLTMKYLINKYAYLNKPYSGI